MAPIDDLIGTRQAPDHHGLVPIEQAAALRRRRRGRDRAPAAPLRPDARAAWPVRSCSRLEMPLVPVLADMELTGVALDMPWLQSFHHDPREDCELEDTDLRGGQAPVQHQLHPAVRHGALRGAGAAERARRTKTGYSTDRDVLDSLRGPHPIVDLIIEYRQLIKLKSPISTPCPLVQPRHRAFHTSFNQTAPPPGGCRREPQSAEHPHPHRDRPRRAQGLHRRQQRPAQAVR